MVLFERALVSSYRLSIVTFPLIFARFRDIVAFVHQYATFSPVPTTPLVSPKFPDVPLGVGGWPWGYEGRS